MLDDALLVRLGHHLAELDAANSDVRMICVAGATYALHEMGMSWADLVMLLRLAVAQGLGDQLGRSAEHPFGDDWQASRELDGRPGYWRRLDGGDVASIRQCRRVPGYPPAWTASINGAYLRGADGKPIFYATMRDALAAVGE